MEDVSFISDVYETFEGCIPMNYPLTKQKIYYGEHTMVQTAPIVYGMYYLQMSDQKTTDKETQATEKIELGMNCSSSSLLS